MLHESCVLQAKLETKALKAKRPGFTDDRYNETSYYIENGEYSSIITLWEDHHSGPGTVGLCRWKNAPWNGYSMDYKLTLELGSEPPHRLHIRFGDAHALNYASNQVWPTQKRSPSAFPRIIRGLSGPKLNNLREKSSNFCIHSGAPLGPILSGDQFRIVWTSFSFYCALKLPRKRVRAINTM